jgi:Cu-processing system permease protein
MFLMPFYTSTLRAGFRGRSFQLVFIFGLLLVGIAYLSSSFSPRQPMTVALDMGFSGIRLGAVLLALFWAQELLGREVDRRTVVFSLTYPLSRFNYLLGRYFGILTLALLALVVLGLLLLAVVLAAGAGYEQEFSVDLGVPYWLALFGIWLDVAVVTAFAMLMSAISTTPMLPFMLGLAFAVAGRSVGVVRDYLMHGADGDVKLAHTYTPLVEWISWVIPDLSRLDWRVGALYRAAPDLATLQWSALSAVGYVTVMLLFAVRSFSKREFS